MMAVTLLLLFIVFGMGFYLYQNKNPKLGGELSMAKAWWLIYAVYTWFIFLPYLISTQFLPPYITNIWKIFWIFMVARGVLEMIMMYITKNWSPLYGISHDLACLAILVGGTCYYWGNIVNLPFTPLAFHFSLIISLILETIYAYGFYQIVKEKTKGEEAIWFASKEDPRFKKLVFLTALMNWPLYAILINYHYFLID